MTSLIFRTATQFLNPLLILFSIFLVIRGHNEPGGGFVGGLMAASAFILYAIAFDARSARQVLRIDPHSLIGAGLLLATFSGLYSLVQGRAFLTGYWREWEIAGLGKIALGNPVYFDFGVYLVVLGVTLNIILTMAED